MTHGLIPLVVAVPLGAGFLAPLVAKSRAGDAAAAALAVIAAVVGLAIPIALCMQPEAMVYWVGTWRSPIGISLVVDGMTRFMLLLTNFVALMALVFGLDYMKRFTSTGLYYALFMLMLAGMNGVILTGDLFNLYVFLEVASISSYGLVAFGTDHEELEASFKYVILGSLGSLFILFGIGFLYNQTGHLNMAVVGSSLLPRGTNGVVSLAVAFMLMGFSLKAALAPFHAWLPDAHPSAPAPVSAMLSGVLIKVLGVYAASRLLFNIVVPRAEVISAVLVLASLSMIVGAFLMLGQRDLKRLLAYCSIGQVGYVVGAIGVGAYALFVRRDASLAAFALFGGLFHLFNHAIFKSLLFLVSGAVEYATGTRDLGLLGGLRKVMPVTAGCCRVGSLAISGIPPFAGFFSKVIILAAMFQARLWALGVIAAAEALLTLLAFLRVQRQALEGDLPEKLAATREVPARMRIAMVTLAVVSLIGGPLVVWLREWLFGPATEALVAEVSAYVTRFLPGGLS